MKRFFATLFGCALVATLSAQSPADNPPPKLEPDELEELVGPIALYPDALIALILPASTYPSDVVLGARFVAADGDPAALEDKSWDSSVKALTRYPETLRWMDENLEWTTQLGDAFIGQPADVMEAIQRLRGRARALGNLNDTPQQRIIQDDADYRIIPAQPDFIYEPRYDPDVIYYERAVGEPLLYFGVGYGVGSWLNYDCDWHRHRLYRGDWHEGWDYRRYADRRDRDDDYRFSNKITNVREWRPDPVRRHEQSHHSFDRSHVQNIQPSRDSSRDSGKGDRKEEHKVSGSAHHAGVARPQTFAGSHKRPESIKRAVPVHEDKNGRGDSPRTAHEDSKDHVARPKSMAPGTSDAGHGKDDNHKKSNDDSPRTPHKAEAPSKHEPEGRVMHVENPKHDSGTQDEPRHKEAPKHEEMKKQDEPKHKEAPKQVERKREEPRHQEAPKQVEHKREEPRHQEAPRHMDAPRRQEAPKHEADKPHGDSPKKGDKKDDDADKKKKKK